MKCPKIKKRIRRKTKPAKEISKGVKMSLPSDPRLLLHNRMEQALLYLREYWIISDELIRTINSSTLTGLILMNKLNSATSVRTNIAGSITDGAVKAELTSQFGIADIDAEITAANQASNAMLRQMSLLLDVVTTNGQIVDADDVDGRIDTFVTSPESDNLLAAAINLRDGGFIDSPVG